ncbi:RNA-directed DNA polymerase, eukaryota [Tanacetum coccineum]
MAPAAPQGSQSTHSGKERELHSPRPRTATRQMVTRDQAKKSKKLNMGHRGRTSTFLIRITNDDNDNLGNYPTKGDSITDVYLTVTTLLSTSHTISTYNGLDQMIGRKNNKNQIMKDLEAIDLMIDTGLGNEEVTSLRVECMNKLLNCNKLESMEVAQKAKVKWAIKGDENSRFFHGIINKKRNIRSIRGVMVDGKWIEDPKSVKQEFLEHFSKRFCKPGDPMATIQMDFPNQINLVQRDELESEISNDEIKKAVWECGSDKAPGPDGFTFGFFRHFWYLIDKEVQDAVRQILDGPFILNEMLSWCNKRKKQSLIFKVDFEKCILSYCVDFLDDVLRKFGFGEKWCKWVQCCLHSSRGSILINGSPTEEFQFGKGLKQGDPLSPFLFILIMETLHLSFQRVVDAGMFHGINLGGTLNLSHMFYADDAVFVGEWSEKNIATLVHVFDYFHKVSGLKINMNKSKIMGTHVDHGKVACAANKLGCLILKTPFLYLGTYVGGNMNRLKSWDDIIDRVKSRLSKWKMNMLSIGGNTYNREIVPWVYAQYSHAFTPPLKWKHVSIPLIKRWK